MPFASKPITPGWTLCTLGAVLKMCALRKTRLDRAHMAVAFFLSVSLQLPGERTALPPVTTHPDLIRRGICIFHVPTCNSRFRVGQKFKVFGHIGYRTVLVAYASLQHKDVVSARPEKLVPIRLGRGIRVSPRRKWPLVGPIR
jgi:hypothetical protein